MRITDIRDTVVPIKSGMGLGRIMGVAAVLLLARTDWMAKRKVMGIEAARPAVAS